MSTLIATGPYEGHVIRTARKAYTCEKLRGWPDPERCGRPINPGDRYVEGDVNPDRAGGFGFDRLCLICGGVQ